MLDAIKNIASGRGKQVEKQTSELELLIATAREERSAISAMLTALTTRSAKLAPLGKSLERGRGRSRRRESHAARIHAAGSAQHAAHAAARA